MQVILLILVYPHNTINMELRTVQYTLCAAAVVVAIRVCTLCGGGSVESVGTVCGGGDGMSVNTVCGGCGGKSVDTVCGGGGGGKGVCTARRWRC